MTSELGGRKAADSHGTVRLSYQLIEGRKKKAERAFQKAASRHQSDFLGPQLSATHQQPMPACFLTFAHSDFVFSKLLQIYRAALLDGIGVYVSQ